MQQGDSMNAIDNANLCQAAISAIRDLKSLDHLPGVIGKIIDTRAWEERDYRGQTIRLRSLYELITKQPVEGWGENPEKIESLLKDDPEVLVKWREAMLKKRGPKDDFCNNITKTNAVTGTSSSYTLSRLERESPELFEEVKKGDLSAHKAAIKAGFRRRYGSVPFDNVHSAVKTLLKHYPAADLIQAIKDQS